MTELELLADILEVARGLLCVVAFGVGLLMAEICNKWGLV